MDALPLHGPRFCRAGRLETYTNLPVADRPLLLSVSAAAAQQGRFAIVATTDDNPKASREAADALIRRGVDGLILTTARENDDLADELRARGGGRV